jgi:hypothetical protein
MDSKHIQIRLVIFEVESHYCTPKFNLAHIRVVEQNRLIIRIPVLRLVEQSCRSHDERILSRSMDRITRTRLFLLRPGVVVDVPAMIGRCDGDRVVQTNHGRVGKTCAGVKESLRALW